MPRDESIIENATLTWFGELGICLRVRSADRFQPTGGAHVQVHAAAEHRVPVLAFPPCPLCLCVSISYPAAKAWTRRLEAIQHQDVWEIIQSVPSSRISKIGRQFTMDLLNENKKRILQMDIR
jgi:hypothetical protein